MFTNDKTLIHSSLLYCGNRFSGEESEKLQRLHDIAEHLETQGIDLIVAQTIDDAREIVMADPSVHCVVIDWHEFDEPQPSDDDMAQLTSDIKALEPNLPIFVLGDHNDQQTLTLPVARSVDEVIWLLQDTPLFISRRILTARDRFLDDILPPLTRAMMSYETESEYPWAAPGHQGGVAYTKSRVGNLFYNHYGEPMFRNDMGIERGTFGSLLEHSGPIGESEKFISHVFGSDLTYSVLNGTSGSNRTIMQAVVGEGDIALCDRNCHKSIAQGLGNTGAIPVYIQAKRNRYGIIGLVPPEEMSAAAVQAKIDAHPLIKDKSRPTYAVLTNCTYDGMCYDSAGAEVLLGESADRIHLDEAWYGYARFHPIYRNRYALRPEPEPENAPTKFVTHSTHKLLAALSQTSYLHLRQGRKPVGEAQLNESYAAQASTSPYYPMIASNEIAAAMMAGEHGTHLIHDVVTEAVTCRQKVKQIRREMQANGDWFFDSWNADKVTDPATGKDYDFADAPIELLANEPSVWEIRQGESWHGFDDLPDGWGMLDPTKFGVVCPGLREDGTFEDTGIPAEILTRYLGELGIIPSRTTAHVVLFLFSMGLSRGKWGTLITSLLRFKDYYDSNRPMEHVVPSLVSSDPARYGGQGLREFCDRMWADMVKADINKAEAAAYETLPEPVMTPRAAQQYLIRGDVEEVASNDLSGRVAAVAVIPYPPGIPIVMPGERFGDNDSPAMRYIRNLENWGHLYPGFERELEGSVFRDGKYWVSCVRES